MRRFQSTPFRDSPALRLFLWFDSNAEEAVNFYLTVFKNSQRLDEVRTTEAGPGPKGSILTSPQTSEGGSGNAPNEKAGHRRTRTRRAVVTGAPDSNRSF